MFSESQSWVHALPALAGQMGRFHGGKTVPYPITLSFSHFSWVKQKRFSTSREAIPRLWTQKTFGKMRWKVLLWRKGCMGPTLGRSKLPCRGLIVWVTQQHTLSLHEPVMRACLFYIVLLQQRTHTTEGKRYQSQCTCSSVFKYRHSRLGALEKRLVRWQSFSAKTLDLPSLLEMAGKNLIVISDPQQQWNSHLVACRG